MAITLARIDDRVIHGQTVTRWAAIRSCDGILVISDAVAHDELRKKVLRAAADSRKIGVYDISQGVGALKKANASHKSFFIIAESPRQFANLKRAGGDFGTDLNVGNMSGTRAGMKSIGHAVCLTEDDVEDFDYLESEGVNLSFQLIPDDSTKSWHEIRARYRQL